MKKRKPTKLNTPSPSPADKKRAASWRNLRKLGTLVLNFALFYALFRILLELSERTRMPWIYYGTAVLYALVTVVLFVVYFVLNGFSFDKGERTREELPAGWSEEKKDTFLEKQPLNKDRAKKVLFVLLPLVVTLLISYIELNFI